jgi:hypothetical protein
MQTKDRPPLTALFQICVTSVLPRGAIYDRKAKTDSVDLLGTYKGLKERFSNRGSTSLSLRPERHTLRSGCRYCGMLSTKPIL